MLGLFYKELTWKEFFAGIKETVLTTGSIMLIVGAASALSWIFTKEQIPQTLTGFMLAHISNKYVFLLIVNLFLIIVGMFVEGNAINIILGPLLAPIAASYGIDPIQFGMVFISIGSISPPMGTLMFVTCGITKCKLKAFIKEAVPFYLLLLLVLALLTFIPAFTTGLVTLFY